MEKILEAFYGRSIKWINFKQDIYVYAKQYSDGEIYEHDVESNEPGYVIEFDKGENIYLPLSELLTILISNK